MLAVWDFDDPLAVFVTPDGPACADFNKVEGPAADDLPALFTARAAEAEDVLARSELDATPFICAGWLASGAAKLVVDELLLGLRVGMIDSVIWKLLITS